MARKPAVGTIVLDDVNNKIDFTSSQDPTEPDPKKAKLRVGRDEWVVWNIQNYFTEPKSLDVTLTFPWKEDESGAPFKEKTLTEKVKALDDDGPGVGTIRKKVDDKATKGKEYKYDILVEAKGLKLDPMLEIDDGANIDPNS